MRRSLLMLAAGFALAPLGLVQAQSAYPSAPIRVIVPTTPAVRPTS